MGKSPAGVVQDMSSASPWARPQQDKALRSPELPMPKPGPHSLDILFVHSFLLGPLKYDLGRFAV